MSDQFLLSRPTGADTLQRTRAFAGDGGSLDWRALAGAATPAPMAERELAARVQRLLAPARARGRRKIWDFDTNLHCSILGTCLTTVELRQALAKLGLKEVATATDHDVHASSVLVAGKHPEGGKLLHKALDRRHRIAIGRFDKAKTADEVRALWADALQSGDIPGAYWAALTHPATNEALVREIFADVHMLSHLVGAANRADIRRLRQLQAENAALQEKVARQQRQLREALVARDATIRDLQRALEARIEGGCGGAPAVAAGWEAVAADLKAQLCRSESRRAGAEQSLAATRAALASERRARSAAEEQATALRGELRAVEASLCPIAEDEPAELPNAELAGLTLLYVGGRAGQIAHIRSTAERHGASLLHHDGGVEERGGLLPGLVSRADAVLFPVDCISHAAMLQVKRLCRQAGKPFLPLRSAGLAPFCAAIRSAALGADEA